MVGTTFGMIAKGQFLSTDDFLNILANIPQERKFIFSVIYLFMSILVKIGWIVVIWKLSDSVNLFFDWLFALGLIQ